MFDLQRLVLPALEFGAPDELYVRLESEKAIVFRQDKTIRFLGPAVASFDTFFNGLSVGKWKTYCRISDLTLLVGAKGRFLVRICLHRRGHSVRILDEWEIRPKAHKFSSLMIEAWPDLEDGMLFATVTALEPGELREMKFATSSSPLQKVKLGVVITHFNRKRQVVPAISRLRNELLEDAAFKGKVELIVVDNSKNITLEEAHGCTLIPNPNLGGSGGFMRGLLHLEDNGTFTHCLFMDDDASCETESIRRAFAIHSLCKAENVAVAGSMLREVEKYRLVEKGARFDGWCRPAHSGLDMRQVDDLLDAEREVSTDYGGWWFLAFRLKDVKHYAFPFFVRGDDIAFGLMHKFDLCTINGVATWGDDFTLKNSPANMYLDIRNHIVIQAALLNSPGRSVCQKFRAAALGYVFSYNYSTAEAMCLAVEHAFRGQAFWEKNFDLVEIRKDLSKLNVAAQVSRIDKSKINLDYQSANRESKLVRFLQNITFGGLLLPTKLFYKKTLYQPKGYEGHSLQIFRYPSVLYEDDATDLGYLARLERRSFFRTYLRVWKTSFKLQSAYNGQRTLQRDTVAQLTTRKFWKKMFSRETQTDSEKLNRRYGR